MNTERFLHLRNSEEYCVCEANAIEGGLQRSKCRNIVRCTGRVKGYWLTMTGEEVSSGHTELKQRDTEFDFEDDVTQNLAFC